MNGDPPSSSKQSFWTTLPGLIAAIAGLITAIAGILVALFQTGIISKSGPPQTATPVNQSAVNQPAVNQSAVNQSAVNQSPAVKSSKQSGAWATVDGTTYTVLSSAYNSEKSLLVLTIKVSCSDKPENFAPELFRLDVDGAMIAPQATLDNHFVAQYSEWKEEVNFPVKADTKYWTLFVGRASTGKTASLTIIR